MMSKTGVLTVGDRITLPNRLGRWTVVDMDDQFIHLAKYRKGVRTDYWKCLATRIFRA